MRQKWLFIVPTIDGEFFGQPEVIKAEDLSEKERNASDATGGEGGYLVFAEVTTDVIQPKGE